MNNKEYKRVYKYYLKCWIYGGESHEYFILAENLDWAMTMINKSVAWDEIIVSRISEVIAWAQYSARDITNDPDENFSLHYHALPVNRSQD